jgi:hypothetical protein
LQFKGGSLAWDVPQGWTTDDSSRADTTTLRTNNGMAVTITQLTQRGASDRLGNVNRWRGQIGLKPLKAEDLDKLIPLTEIAGVKNACIVDISGSQLEQIFPPDPVTFTPGREWKPRKSSISDVVAAYQAGDGSDEIRISVSELTGEHRGLDENLSRWGGQVGLSDLNEIKKFVSPVKVDGETAHRAELISPAKERLVGVVCERGDVTWVFFMKGPDAAIEKQRPAFDEMLKSVKFAAKE